MDHPDREWYYDDEVEKKKPQALCLRFAIKSKRFTQWQSLKSEAFR